MYHGQDQADPRAAATEIQTAARTRNLPMFFYVLPYVPGPPASRRRSVAHCDGRHIKLCLLSTPPWAGRVCLGLASEPSWKVYRDPGDALAQSPKNRYPMRQSQSACRPRMGDSQCQFGERRRRARKARSVPRSALVSHICSLNKNANIDF